MNTDFRQCIAKPVVRLEDIAALRLHLEHKYPDILPTKRAEMMAQGIHKMIDTSLIGLDLEHKSTIKKRLISHQLIDCRKSVLKMDVLNCIFDLELNSDQVVSKAWGWYILNTGHSISMAEFTDSVTLYMPHKLRKTLKDSSDRSSYTDKIKESKDVVMPNDHKSISKSGSVYPLFTSFITPLRKALHSRLSSYKLTKKGYICLSCLTITFLSMPFAISSIGKVVALIPTVDTVYASPLSAEAEDLIVTKDLIDLIPTKTKALNKPEYLKYQDFSLEKLKSFLLSKNSMLLQNDYLNELLSYCYEKDINPILMIAIIGQEQNYVPSQHPFALKIIENPFNIYGSWETHPIGFATSLKEACFRVNKDLDERPLYEDPFQVLNRKYAQDPNWYLGVKTIFKDLSKQCMIK